MSVDGPKGPIHEVKKGAAFLAGRMNIPIVPVACAASRAWVLESTWEKPMLPVPFCRGLVLFGNPVYVSGASEEAIESGRVKLERALRCLDRDARDLMVRTDKGRERAVHEKCHS